MTNAERLAAIEEIKQAKARYFRGVDTSDGGLVRSVLARDCVLDYMGCCTDPATGRDFMPAMNIVMKGRASWTDGGFEATGIVSVHQGYNFDITFENAETAHSICAMTDRLHMPTGGAFSVMVGYGYYHETYVKEDGAWKIQKLRIQRLRVEAR